MIPTAHGQAACPPTLPRLARGRRRRPPQRSRLPHWTREEGVGLPRDSPSRKPTLAWNDVRDMESGTVEHTITVDTLPGVPRERIILYKAPFDRCDYEVVWKHFAERFAEERR